MKKLLLLIVSLLMITALVLLASCGTSTPATTETETTTQAPIGTTQTAVTTQIPSITANLTTTQAPNITPTPDNTVTLDENSVSIRSLNGGLTMDIKKTENGKIAYTLTAKDGTLVIGESTIGLTIGSEDVFEGASFKNATAKELNVSYNHLGNFSTLTDHCVAANVTMQKNGYEFAIEVKLYDNGVAFRYNLPKTGSSRLIKGEATSFAVQNLNKVWYGANSDCYEDSIKSAKYTGISTSDKLTGPLMIELANNGGYISLLEGYVETTYIGTNYISTGKNNTFKVSGSWTSGKDFDTFRSSDDILTGWRIVNYSKDLSDIVLNDTIYHTALGIEGNAPANTDTDWITPGKSVWSWLSETGDRVRFDSQIEYTLNAAKLGFTYNIIDDGYPKWSDYEDKLLYLGLLGEDVGVKQILWASVTNVGSGLRVPDKAAAKTVMQKLANLHLSGIKLDFFNAETNTTTHDIQQAVLAEGMALHLVVNFHGVHKPTAYSVLYPNELTREAIKGLESLSKTNYSAQASYIVSQFYTRLLAGHADFTPEVMNGMQMASLIVLDSPMMVLAANPTDLLKSESLEMVRAIPTVWDQTVFLDGTVGKYVSLAKEKDGVWYIGGITTTSKAVEVDLSKILGDGEYLLTGWVDDSTTKKSQITQTVTKDTKLDLGTIKSSCGYVFQITKLSISQHGGEITGPITVKTASSTAVVKYTLDGSDPMTSASAVVAGETITLTESALLRIAITEGDGKGTAFSYQFNKVVYNGISESIEQGDSKATITLTPTIEGAKLYYTLDGSTPTSASTEYKAPFVLTESVTLKVIAVTAEGKVSPVKIYNVGVAAAVPSITPDVYIGSDYTEAKTDWGNVCVDKSMNNTTLSLGGVNTTSGTKFSHGISANAKAHFVYNIPENVTKFVGVAGIDDSNYQNTIEGYKASTIVKIYIDGVLKYTTAKLGCGQYEQIEVEIPAGAKVIRIEFGDAGDGISCDNVDLCDAGFILAK